MQYIKKPRFFTDFISAQRQGGYSVTLTIDGGAGGIATSSNKWNLIDNNPSNWAEFNSSGTSDTIKIVWKDWYGAANNTINSSVDCVQILGHNLDTAGAKIRFFSGSTEASLTNNTISGTIKQLTSCYGSMTELTTNDLQGNPVPNKSYRIDDNGSHILKLTSSNTDAFWGLMIDPTGTNFLADVKIGAIRIGDVIVAPHAVNVSEKHENPKNYKKVKSVGGNVYSYRTHKNPTWLENTAPFQNYTTQNMAGMPNHTYGITPKSYSMDFSYVNDSDYANSSESLFTLQSDKTFNSLYNKTLNGHLPIVMQKDDSANQSNKLTDFSWGYIDSFKRTRIAPDLWNISMGFSEDM